MTEGKDGIPTLLGGLLATMGSTWNAEAKVLCVLPSMLDVQDTLNRMGHDERHNHTESLCILYCLQRTIPR